MKKKVVRPGYMTKELKKVRIPVGELQIGMFVCELDRPWIDTPFLIQGFLIESMEHIELVQEFCEFVYVDAVQEQYVPAEERAVSNRKQRTRYINKVSFEQEQTQATGIFKHARQLTKSVMDEVRLGNALDANKAKETVEDCVDSIIRNPDALMWLSKIRNVDSYTADHSLNVAILAIAFGRHLGFERDDLTKLGLCGLLHDIGKMKIPQEILQKTQPLTEDEMSILQGHPIHGRNILMSHPNLYHGITDVAHSHHEHLDGTGYPRGIKEMGLSPNTRIISIVDTYDNYTTSQPRSPARSSLEAMRYLYAKRGAKFDSQLVDSFIQCVGLYPPGSIVELKNGYIGLVISTNYRNRRLPKILLLLDDEKESISNKIVNLGDPRQQGQRKEYLIKHVHVDGSFGIHLKEHLARGLTFS